MESLFATSQLLVNRVDTTYVRDKHDEIDWDSRLIAILGARGTGKTTMILQHIRLHNTTSQALYVMADDFYFTSHRLEELAHKFMLLGGKYLYIDEIHKYKGWSTEIKNIYDKMPDLHVVYSGSSILDLEKGGADLSRSEYLNISQGWNLPRYTLEEILAGKVDFPYNEARPLQLFASYMREGYYPFFREGNYAMRLNGIIKQVVEDDVPKFAEMEIASVQKLKKLLYVLAQNVPFKPNYAKLERDLGISRNTLPKYMLYLEKAGLIGVLREKVYGIKLLEKIEKIYLNNPNEAYILSDEMPNIGTLRETIFFAWLRVEHFVSSSSVSDFEVDGLTFEIGGKNKGRKQLEILPLDKAYVVKDDTEYVFQNSIPLWMFGFVY